MIFFELNLKEKIIFKIDTQGYEFKVLQGAEKVLKEFKGILIEVSLANYLKDKRIG